MVVILTIYFNQNYHPLQSKLATFNNNGDFEYEISEDYHSKIRDRKIQHIDKGKSGDYHLFYSSCLWLQENSIISKMILYCKLT